MAWKVEVDTERGFIHSVYSGVLTKEDVLAATAETLKIAAGKGPQKFLTEWADATSTLSTSEIFGIPGEWDKAKISRRSVLALVVPKDGPQWEDAVFYETVCQNRGWRVRVFTQRDDAIEWLEKQDTT